MAMTMSEKPRRQIAIASGMRVREPDERSGERDAEQREPEDDERAPVRRRVAHGRTVSA